MLERTILQGIQTQLDALVKGPKLVRIYYEEIAKET